MRKIVSTMLLVCLLLTISVPALATSIATVDTSVGNSTESVQSDIKQRGPYKGMVTQNGVNIRTGPGTQYPSYGHMNKGDIVWIYNYINAPWAYVLCDSPHKGQFAYIHMQYIREIAD